MGHRTTRISYLINLFQRFLYLFILLASVVHVESTLFKGDTRLFILDEK